MVGTSRDFDITVGVHQGSALSPLLFITAMEETAKMAQEGGPLELLYADDLVLTSESREEVTDKFNRWRDEMEQRGLKINVDKTKLVVTGKKAKERIQSGRWPYGSCICGRRVGGNSVFCTVCKKWCHQCCSELRNIRGVQNFVCPRYEREEGDGSDGREEGDIAIEANSGVLEELEQ